MSETARASLRLADRIKPLLHGQGPEIQSGALVELVSLNLAGHVVIGDADATEELREALLQAFVSAVRHMTRLNAEHLGTALS